MPEVYSKEEVQELLRPLQVEIQQLKQEIQQLVGTVWIDQEDAMKLTGRSYAWFYQNRNRGTLPIAMLPRDEGSRRIKYSRADCVAYGIKHRILPPDYPGATQ